MLGITQPARDCVLFCMMGNLNFNSLRLQGVHFDPGGIDLRSAQVLTNGRPQLAALGASLKPEGRLLQQGSCRLLPYPPRKP